MIARPIDRSIDCLLIYFGLFGMSYEYVKCLISTLGTYTSHRKYHIQMSPTKKNKTDITVISYCNCNLISFSWERMISLNKHIHSIYTVATVLIPFL